MYGCRAGRNFGRDLFRLVSRYSSLIRVDGRPANQCPTIWSIVMREGRPKRNIPSQLGFSIEVYKFSFVGTGSMAGRETQEEAARDRHKKQTTLIINDTKSGTKQRFFYRILNYCKFSTSAFCPRLRIRNLRCRTFFFYSTICLLVPRKQQLVARNFQNLA